jgi:hypothetical protein
MSDWATHLANDLDAALPKASLQLGIRDAKSGPEFEQALGQFLQWQQSLPLTRQFLLFGGPEVGAANGEMQRWLKSSEERVEAVTEALRTSLYRNFGAARIDANKSRAAFGRLLKPLGDECKLVVATTNYDPSVEIALEQLGYQVLDGFQRPGARLTPVLNPASFRTWTERAGRDVPVMHLHGAVGWYRRQDGAVIQQAADQDYNATLGVPVVLPPDPNKDPLNDANVSALWAVLTTELAAASGILVVGHSLHDPALVRALQSASHNARILIATKECANVPHTIRAAYLEFELTNEPVDLNWVGQWFREEAYHPDVPSITF